MRTPALPALLLLALAATAAAGRDLRGLDTSLPAAVNATTAETRGLFSESWEYLESLFEFTADFVVDRVTNGAAHVCVYGSNCGWHCTSSSYDESDPLDTACYRHDRCLEQASGSTKATCRCHSDLIAEADYIGDTNGDTDLGRTARVVKNAIRGAAHLDGCKKKKKSG